MPHEAIRIGVEDPHRRSRVPPPPSAYGYSAYRGS